MLGHRRRGAFRVAILNGPQGACVVRHRFGELSADVRELKIGMSLGHDQFDDLGEDSIAGDFSDSAVKRKVLLVAKRAVFDFDGLLAKDSIELLTLFAANVLGRQVGGFPLNDPACRQNVEQILFRTHQGPLD